MEIIRPGPSWAAAMPAAYPSTGYGSLLPGLQDRAGFGLKNRDHVDAVHEGLILRKILGRELPLVVTLGQLVEPCLGHRIGSKDRQSPEPLRAPVHLGPGFGLGGTPNPS